MKFKYSRMKITSLIFLFTVTVFFSCAQEGTSNNDYTKIERMIPMRDGIKLFTTIYIPKDSSENYPILMMRTPYSVAPYGEDNFRKRLGPNPCLQMKNIFTCTRMYVAGT